MLDAVLIDGNPLVGFISAILHQPYGALGIWNARQGYSVTKFGNILDEKRVVQ